MDILTNNCEQLSVFDGKSVFLVFFFFFVLWYNIKIYLESVLLLNDYKFADKNNNVKDQ